MLQDQVSKDERLASNIGCADLLSRYKKAPSVKDKALILYTNNFMFVSRFETVTSRI